METAKSRDVCCLLKWTVPPGTKMFNACSVLGCMWLKAWDRTTCYGARFSVYRSSPPHWDGSFSPFSNIFIEILRRSRFSLFRFCFSAIIHQIYGPVFGITSMVTVIYSTEERTTTMKEPTWRRRLSLVMKGVSNSSDKCMSKWGVIITTSVYMEFESMQCSHITVAQCIPETENNADPVLIVKSGENRKTFQNE